MKKILIFCFGFLFLAFSLSPAFGQFKFGLKAGAGINDMSYKTTLPDDIDFRSVYTYHVGGLMEYDFKGPVGIGLGLQLQQKGGYLEFDAGQYNLKLTSRPLYIQAPLQIILHGKGVYGAIGPFYAVGIGGKTRLTSTPKFDDLPDVEEVSVGVAFGNSDYDDYRTSEMGLSVDFGFESKTGLRFTFNYSQGLTDLTPRDVANARIPENRLTSGAFNVSVAYLFHIHKVD